MTCSGTAIIIGADNITLDGAGHTITGDTSGGGIENYGYNYITVKNCIITNFNHGILLQSCSHNTLDSNTANSNVGAGNAGGGGILLNGGSNNSFTNNRASLNVYTGILLIGSSNILTNNTTNSNGVRGIDVGGSNNVLTANTANSNPSAGISLGGNANTVTNNTANLNGVGIFLYNSNGNTLDSNNASSNSLYGIWVFYSNSNVLTANTVNSNSSDGIFLYFDSSSNTVGGTITGASNTIAFNGGNGVDVVEGQGATGNTISQNSIFSNSRLGIDLGGDGVTPNDPGDADNNLHDNQNFPVLYSVSSSGGFTTITGALNSTPNTTFTIEFFSNDAGDPSGFGEGQTFIGSTQVTTGADCDDSFTAVFPVTVSASEVVTMTATNSSGTTSEFSSWVPSPRPISTPAIPFAWGSNDYGELGNGSTTDSSTPVQASGLTGVTAIAGGGFHSLALTSCGTVWAWGFNSSGELGNGTTSNSSIPLQVSSLTEVVAIRAGSGDSLALKSDGTVWAWGNNFDGELGNGSTTNSSTPVQVTFVPGVTAIAIAAGGFHSFALDSNGVLWAWGSNSHGELGNGSTTDSSIPVQVSGLTGVTAISGGGSHSLALKSDGTVWAWGSNFDGELGNGSTTDSSTPVQVSGLTGVIAISGGGDALAQGGHSLALKSDGTAWAWGNNFYGELGNGSTADSSTPVQVSGLTGVTAISGGGSHSLALKSDGTAWAWGDNDSGQLGDGNSGSQICGGEFPCSSIPVQVSSLARVIAIAGGGLHSQALTPIPVQLVSVVSELTHGSAGPFDINLPLTGTRGVECRTNASLGASNYMLVYTFANTLTSVAGASVTSGTGMVSSSSIGTDPHQYIVNLTGVTNAQYIAVTLTNVNDSVGDSSSSVLGPSMGVLIGDVNASGRVDSADVSLVRQQTLQPIISSNFRDDINASGRIDAADVSTVRQQTLTSLPSPP